MKASTISRVIKANTKLDKSTTERGRVSDVVSEGYVCKQDGENVKVYYVSTSLNHNSEKGHEIFLERQHGALYLMNRVLKSKGYEVIKSNNLLIVKRGEK